MDYRGDNGRRKPAESVGIVVRPRVPLTPPKSRPQGIPSTGPGPLLMRRASPSRCPATPSPFFCMLWGRLRDHSFAICLLPTSAEKRLLASATDVGARPPYTCVLAAGQRAVRQLRHPAQAPMQTRFPLEMAGTPPPLCTLADPRQFFRRKVTFSVYWGSRNENKNGASKKISCSVARLSFVKPHTQKLPPLRGQSAVANGNRCH